MTYHLPSLSILLTIYVSLRFDFKLPITYSVQEKILLNIEIGKRFLCSVVLEGIYVICAI